MHQPGFATAISAASRAQGEGASMAAQVRMPSSNAFLTARLQEWRIPMSSALTMSLISSCDELICTPLSESTLLILNLFAFHERRFDR